MDKCFNLWPTIASSVACGIKGMRTASHLLPVILGNICSSLGQRVLIYEVGLIIASPSLSHCNEYIKHSMHLAWHIADPPSGLALNIINSKWNDLFVSSKLCGGLFIFWMGSLGSKPILPYLGRFNGLVGFTFFLCSWASWRQSPDFLKSQQQQSVGETESLRVQLSLVW